MNALKQWGLAAAEVWGLILLLALLISLAIVTVLWLFELRRWIEVRRTRRRYSAEAIAQAEALLRRASSSRRSS